MLLPADFMAGAEGRSGAFSGKQEVVRGRMEKGGSGARFLAEDGGTEASRCGKELGPRVSELN